jgi:hypothetical protein
MQEDWPRMHTNKSCGLAGDLKIRSHFGLNLVLTHFGAYRFRRGRQGLSDFRRAFSCRQQV